MLSVTLDLATEQAVDALDSWLVTRNYNARARAGIADHIREFGDLSDCVHLDRDDLNIATEILVDAFPAVPPDDASWSDDGRWTPRNVVQATPPELEDPFEPSAEDWADYHRHFNEVDLLDAIPIHGYE